MPVSTKKARNQRSGDVAEVTRMRDYSKEPAFKKKEDKARVFLDKHGLPEGFAKKK